MCVYFLYMWIVFYLDVGQEGKTINKYSLDKDTLRLVQQLTF